MLDNSISRGESFLCGVLFSGYDRFTVSYLKSVVCWLGHEVIWFKYDLYTQLFDLRLDSLILCQHSIWADSRSWELGPWLPRSYGISYISSLSTLTHGCKYVPATLPSRRVLALEKAACWVSSSDHKIPLEIPELVGGMLVCGWRNTSRFRQIRLESCKIRRLLREMNVTDR